MRGRAGTRSDLSAILWDGSCGRVIFRKEMAVLSHLISATSLSHLVKPSTWLHSPFCKKLAWVPLRKVRVPVSHPLSLAGSCLHATVVLSPCRVSETITGEVVIVPCSNRDTAGILSIHMCACVWVHWGSGTFPSNARKRSSKAIFSEKHVHILGIWKPTKNNITSLNPPSR